MSAATTAATVSPQAPSTRPAVSQLVRTTRYSLASIGATLRQGMFLFFTVALPIAMFLMFNALFGKEADGEAGRQIMVSMAAYGGLGAAFNAGSNIQLERANGWLRQLMVAGLTPRAFVVGKIIAAMVVVLPAIVGVMIFGVLFSTATITVGEFVLTILALTAAMLPLILLGLVIGLALPPNAVNAATTIGMMALAVLGGLWFPAELFPDWMVTVAHLTPTYWVGELGRKIAAGQAAPVTAVLVLAAWTIASVLLAMLLLRRGARTTSRR